MSARTISKTRVMVVNGPNLNLLGFREPAAYGTRSIKDLETLVRDAADLRGVEIDFRQSNHEGVIIDWLHEARTSSSAVILNPAALTHTSIGIRDAVLALDVPVAEVHISNIHARESFRNVSYVSEVADVVIIGAGFFSYVLGLHAVLETLDRRTV
ncbi:type II 3-dehydroquinate dehydratase [Alpinimonas psychrophila]|uniref:3-dehydroquinate dehydratase n=1 Tax=Alpinimonas psychrophila TaxID=748908 RepID=A0A7W3JTE6_9MICO|nr:3-dehydroquinate dehydratase-2 [Alpinimonas psychrophila]